MGASTRIRSASLGHSACFCPLCCNRGSGDKKRVRKLIARKVRRTARAEIAETE